MVKKGPALYILHGPPRIGKQKLVDLFLALHPGTRAIEGDNVRATLWTALDEHKLHHRPLFQMLHDNETYPDEASWMMMASWPGYIQERQWNMHTEVWRKGILPQIAYHMKLGHSLIVEGVAAYPELVAELPYDFHYVAVGTQHGQAEHMIRHARENPDIDWMANWSESRIRKYAELQAEMSRACAEEAEKFGLCYVEMS
ncbi:MAG TPA: hypothetical protein VFZ48_04300, partial [Candidatus Saccharimonadales bacterium]